MWPETVLQAFYGADSIYVGGQLSLRILGVAFMLNFVTELICSFMHGINSARIAFTINFLGTVIVVALAVPMIAGFGWLGAYWALLLANTVRLMTALGFLKQVISNGQARAV
jgi:O-antigen/teichoic acid export membrane protein